MTSDVSGLPHLGRCRVMGVINVTPDSFSDGGAFDDADSAVKHGLQLLAAGSDMLDVGGESTRPGARRVSPEEEQLRVLPVIRALAEAGAIRQQEIGRGDRKTLPCRGQHQARSIALSFRPRRSAFRHAIPLAAQG